MQSIIKTIEQKALALEILRILKNKFPKVEQMKKNNLEVEDFLNEEILKIVNIECV